MKVYLDNAATTAIHPDVVNAMIPVLQNQFGNPSSIHAYGREVRSLIESSRKKVAALLKTTPAEIFFTSGGTEADNMAIRCGIHDLGLKHAITTALEHHAVLHTLEELDKKGKIQLHFVNLLPKGHIDTQHLEQLLQQYPNALVSLMHANNELGTMIDIDEVSQLCEKYNAVMHCDTVQTIGHFPLDLSKTKIDFIACAAHKFNGPKGVEIGRAHV